MRHRTEMCVLMMILGLSLSACGGAEGGNRAEQLALDIRGEYLEMGGCTASLELTADYGQRVYTYGIGLNYAREGGDHPDHHCAGEYRRGHRPYSGGGDRSGVRRHAGGDWAAG